jgi:hypothetical protein
VRFPQIAAPLHNVLRDEVALPACLTPAKTGTSERAALQEDPDLLDDVGVGQ